MKSFFNTERFLAIITFLIFKDGAALESNQLHEERKVEKYIYDCVIQI